jgi:curved DNA-binding protein CbpA
MATNADPWRTLGLAPGATQDEIRRAYRRLAKLNHPDAAGDAALPRFLAIQAAYDQLAGPGRIRRVGARPPSRATDPGPAGEPREPWRADPGRARASGRADGRRTPGARPSGAAPRPRSTGAGATGPGTSGAGGPGAPASGAAGGATPRPGPGQGPAGHRTGSRATGTDAGSGAGTGPGATGAGPGPAGESTSGRGRRSSGRRRPANTATPGSTSYEGADREPFEPGWSGATWYGASSGTYWTINPKEYADPRKHGPEYQARARRARDGWILDEPGETAADDRPAESEADGPTAADDGGAAGSATSDAAAPDARTHANGHRPPADAPSRDDVRQPEPPPFARARTSERPGGRRHRPDGHGHPADPSARAAGETTAPAPGPDAARASEPRPIGPRWADQAGSYSPGDPGRGGPPAAGLHSWIEQPPDASGFRGPLLRRPTTPAGRLAMALLGWPPLGVFAAAAIDQSTGCGRYAASCPEISSPGTWIVQAAILLLLLALPVVAAWSAHGTIATLVIGVPSSIALSAAGGTNVREMSGPILLSVLALAYLIGVAYAAVVGRRPALT